MKFNGKGIQAAWRLPEGMTIMSFNNSINLATTSHELTIADRKL